MKKPRWQCERIHGLQRLGLGIRGRRHVVTVSWRHSGWSSKGATAIDPVLTRKRASLSRRETGKVGPPRPVNLLRGTKVSASATRSPGSASVLPLPASNSAGIGLQSIACVWLGCRHRGGGRPPRQQGTHGMICSVLRAAPFFVCKKCRETGRDSKQDIQGLLSTPAEMQRRHHFCSKHPALFRLAGRSDPVLVALNICFIFLS